MSSSFLKNLSWRRAFRDFDTTTPKEEPLDITPILNAIVLAPSSFGIQPYCVYVVRDRETRRRLHEVSFHQDHVISCDMLLIFCVRTDILERVDEFVTYTNSTEELKQLILQFLGSFSDQTEWASRQAYIALGFALAAAAELKIQTCPMEGFIPLEVKKILELPENVRPVVYLAVGRGSEKKNMVPKFRFPHSDIIRGEI
jgi:nitroreductase